MLPTTPRWAGGSSSAPSSSHHPTPPPPPPPDFHFGFGFGGTPSSPPSSSHLPFNPSSVPWCSLSPPSFGGGASSSVPWYSLSPPPFGGTPSSAPSSSHLPFNPSSVPWYSLSPPPFGGGTSSSVPWYSLSPPPFGGDTSSSVPWYALHPYPHPPPHFADTPSPVSWYPPPPPRFGGTPSSGSWYSLHPPPSFGDTPSAVPSYRPPPPPRFGGTPSSVPCDSHPPDDCFDFILKECGSISPDQEALLDRSPFIRPRRGDADVVRSSIDHIISWVFGTRSPHPNDRRRCFSDAEAAELALADCFLRLGYRHLHLLRQRPPQEGEQDGRTQLPSRCPHEAAKERPEGMPPPAEASPSFPLEAAAETPTRSSGAREEKGAALKRGRPSSCYPSLDECSMGSKKPRVGPNTTNPTATGTSPLDAGVNSTGDMPAMMAGRPPSADHCGGRGFRKLPPSILCPVNWEEGGVGDERGTYVRRERPPPQMEQEAAASKAPAAAHAPSASSPVDPSLPAENARAASSSAAEKHQGGVDKGDVDRPSPNLTALVEANPPSPMVRSDAIAPAGATDVISLSTCVDIFLRFLDRPIQTPEHPLETLLAKSIHQMRAHRWWGPGVHDRPSTPPDK